MRVGLLDGLEFVRKALELVRGTKLLLLVLLLRFSLVLGECLFEQPLVLSEGEHVLKLGVLGQIPLLSLQVFFVPEFFRNQLLLERGDLFFLHHQLALQCVYLLSELTDEVDSVLILADHDPGGGRSPQFLVLLTHLAHVRLQKYDLLLESVYLGFLGLSEGLQLAVQFAVPLGGNLQFQLREQVLPLVPVGRGLEALLRTGMGVMLRTLLRHLCTQSRLRRLILSASSCALRVVGGLVCSCVVDLEETHVVRVGVDHDGAVLEGLG